MVDKIDIIKNINKRMPVPEASPFGGGLEGASKIIVR
jgi:hypothetical protein